MANNNNQINFQITGNTTGLNNALNQGTTALTTFGNQAGGVLGNTASMFEKFNKSMNGFGGGLVGFAGGAGLAVAGITSLVMASNNYVRELNEISKASGLSVEMLQKMDKAFYGVGLNMEKYADINRDVLDHLGDAFRDGSGPAEDMKAYGLKLQDFNKYLNQSDGGIRALANSFYEMQKAGKSTAEITNMLETLGSDGSKLVEIMKQYSNETDLMNAIQEQQIQLTDENAQKYAEFDKKVDALSTTFQLWKANALAGTVDELNDILNVMNSSKWTSNSFIEMMKKFYYGGDTAFAKWARNLDGVQEVGYSNAATDRLKKQANNMMQFVKDNTQKVAPKDGWVNKEKEAKDAEAVRKKLESAAKSAAAKAEAAAKAAAAKRVQAQKNLEQALSQIGETEGDIRIKAFERQQKEIQDKIRESAKTLGMTQEQLNKLLGQASSSTAMQRTKLTDEMIGRTDPNQDLKSLNQNLGGGLSLNQGQKSYLADQQSQRINGDNPFMYDGTAQKQTELDEKYNLEMQLNEKLLGGTEDYEKRKAQIEVQYARQSMDLATENTRSQMAMISSSAGDLGTMLAGVFGESSGAAKAAFAVQKGITIAQTVLSIQAALAQALATPFPASLAAYAQIASMGASIISTARGTTAQGQAHSGIESVPGSLGKDSTWILQAGERVVSRGQNEQLQQFLDKNDSNKSSSNEYTINAPLIVQGDVSGDDAKFNAMLKKHANSVNQAVRSAQTRNT